jgi:hypothetical protein
MKTLTQPVDIESDLPSTRDSDVTLRKSANPQAPLGMGPVVGEADVPITGEAVPPYGKRFLHDLQTLSKMRLRQVYKGEAKCHEKMLARVKEFGAKADPRLRLFKDFLAIVKPKPTPTATLDRRYNDIRDYLPENIRWADKVTQTNNRGCTILFQPPGSGEPLTSRQLSRRLKVPENTLRQRRNRGWTDAEIMSGKRSPTSTNVVLPKIPVESDPLEGVWAQAMFAAYPGEAFVLSAAERGMLKTFAQTCPDASEVLTHTIMNWTDFARKVRFDHGRHPDGLPGKPTLDFLLKHVRAAQNLYLKDNNLIIGEDLRVRPGPSDEERLAAANAEYREQNDRLLGRQVARVPAEPEPAVGDKDNL